MRVPPHYTDVSDGRVTTGGVYYCTSRAYVPFIVQAKYGWSGGSLYGDGGSALYLWFCGPSLRIHELERWAQ